MIVSKFVSRKIGVFFLLFDLAPRWQKYENLVQEGFWARFVKTEGLWEEQNNRILQLFKENVSFYTNFSHFFTGFEENWINTK